MDNYWESIMMCYLMTIMMITTMNHSENSNILSAYCQLKTVQLMMETTNIMSQFLLEDNNFLKTLV
jgi:hypothetical protein